MASKNGHMVGNAWRYREDLMEDLGNLCKNDG